MNAHPLKKFDWTSFQRTLTDTGKPAKQQHGAGLWHMLESWKQEFCSTVVCYVCIDGYLDATKIGAWKRDQRSESVGDSGPRFFLALFPAFPAQLEKHSTQKVSPPPAQRDSYEGSLFPGGGKLENLLPSVSLAWLLLQTRDSDLAWTQDSSPCWGAQLFSFASPQMLRGTVGFDGRRVTSFL